MSIRRSPNCSKPLIAINLESRKAFIMEQAIFPSLPYLDFKKHCILTAAPCIQFIISRIERIKELNVQGRLDKELSFLLRHKDLAEEFVSLLEVPILKFLHQMSNSILTGEAHFKSNNIFSEEKHWKLFTAILEQELKKAQKKNLHKQFFEKIKAHLGHLSRLKKEVINDSLIRSFLCTHSALGDIKELIGHSMRLALNSVGRILNKFKVFVLYKWEDDKRHLHKFRRGYTICSNSKKYYIKDLSFTSRVTISDPLKKEQLRGFLKDTKRFKNLSKFTLEQSIRLEGKLLQILKRSLGVLRNLTFLRIDSKCFRSISSCWKLFYSSLIYPKLNELALKVNFDSLSVVLNDFGKLCKIFPRLKCFTLPKFLVKELNNEKTVKTYLNVITKTSSLTTQIMHFCYATGYHSQLESLSRFSSALDKHATQMLNLHFEYASCCDISLLNKTLQQMTNLRALYLTINRLVSTNKSEALYFPSSLKKFRLITTGDATFTSIVIQGLLHHLNLLKLDDLDLQFSPLNIFTNHLEMLSTALSTTSHTLKKVHLKLSCVSFDFLTNLSTIRASSIKLDLSEVDDYQWTEIPIKLHPCLKEFKMILKEILPSPLLCQLPDKARLKIVVIDASYLFDCSASIASIERAFHPTSFKNLSTLILCFPNCGCSILPEWKSFFENELSGVTCELRMSYDKFISTGL